jgi:nitrite reductase (NADH) small subunit/3-phenylpropionate/trans-cinnamate dioxygenase ferredoxin subunit
MMEYQTVGKVSDFPARALKSVKLNDDLIVVVQLDGRFYAFTSFCTHLGESLADGYLSGSNIVCAYHGATFDLATGITKGPDPNLPVYEVRVEGDEVQVGRRSVA